MPISSRTGHEQTLSVRDRAAFLVDRVPLVTASESIILVVNRSVGAAQNLKELIEFMDTPRVCVTAPEHWREALGECRLQALFLGTDLGDTEVEALLADVGKYDPNASIVMLTDGSSA